MKTLRSLFMAILIAAPLAAATSKPVLPWIEDDYAKAVARARTKNVPLFVEAWAPW